MPVGSSSCSGYLSAGLRLRVVEWNPVPATLVAMPGEGPKGNSSKKSDHGHRQLAQFRAASFSVASGVGDATGESAVAFAKFPLPMRTNLFDIRQATQNR
jgi:hypothetical protein